MPHRALAPWATWSNLHQRLEKEDTSFSACRANNVRFLMVYSGLSFTVRSTDTIHIELPRDTSQEQTTGPHELMSCYGKITRLIGLVQSRRYTSVM